MRYVYLILVMAALGGCRSNPSPDAQEIIRMIEDDDLDWEQGGFGGGWVTIKLVKLEIAVGHYDQGCVFQDGKWLNDLDGDSSALYEAAKKRHKSIVTNSIKRTKFTAIDEKLKRLKKEQAQ